MEAVRVLFSSLFSLLALFVFTKINGNRQISELTVFDYIISISIGSIAAEMATELESPLRPLIAMAVYSLVLLIISYLTTKSIILRRLIFGRAIVLIENGKLLHKSFIRGHIDINEFLGQCRCQGYFDVSAIKTAILEQNGKLSILPFSKDRNVTIKDMGITTDFEGVFYNAVIDGKILHENLRLAGFDEDWLLLNLKSQGFKNVKDVFLAVVDKSGKLNAFKYNDTVISHDIFE